MTPVFIVLNAGSSSLKFQVFDVLDYAEPRVAFKGLFEGLGDAAHFVVRDMSGTILDEMWWGSGERVGHEGALMHLVSWMRQHQAGRKLAAIGHRIVHGGDLYSGPVLVDEAVLQTLDTLVPLAPLHQPHNLEPIRIIRHRLSGIPQVACFDTAFHQSQPEIAQMFAIPREMRERGVRRYGFHGLSYEYIASALQTYDPHLGSGRVVVAHLGPHQRGARDRTTDAERARRSAATARIMNMEVNVMETLKMKPEESRTEYELGDESFMSASDLQAYMTEMQMAQASKAVEQMGRAEKARQELVKQMSVPVDPKQVREIVKSLQARLRSAAAEGKTELMVMRFPNSLCTDKGRAINNTEADWPETLTGRPRQAYELWREHLRPAGYRLAAMIIEWPGGLPGDVGFFLRWKAGG
jgi:hypothetical protein